MTDILPEIVVAPEPKNAGRAAGLLEQAIRVGCRDTAASYLLAMCCKRLGRNADALTALSRISEPDANVSLQRGLLAYAEKDFAQAEKDFARSFELDKQSFAAGYNLLLAQLCSRKRSEGAALIDQLIPLAPHPAEKRFLGLLWALLLCDAPTGLPVEGAHIAQLQQSLASIADGDETRLVDLLAGLGQFDIMVPLLKMLVQIRPQSLFLWLAHFQITLVRGKELIDGCKWQEAQSLLEPISRMPIRPDAQQHVSSWRLALLNMLGVCACMTQDFDRGLAFFRSAIELFGHDVKNQGKLSTGHGVNQEAWLEQNIALAFEFMGKLDKAETHWNRYFDHLEQNIPRSQPVDYLANLAFEGLNRLAELYTNKEKWSSALGFLSRAHKLRPADADVLERLFHLYDQLHKPDEARKILERLRQMRPNDAQVELFELSTRQVRDLNDIAMVMADVKRIDQKYPGNAHVGERIVSTISNLLPIMERLFDQWNNQINKVLDQMRRLPSYQINWPMVRDVMHDLEDKFLQLRKAAGRGQSFTQGTLRRDLQRLVTQCDRKVEQCHSLAE
jgi:tetratricopeptide (TPR) repeat protein